MLISVVRCECLNFVWSIVSCTDLCLRYEFILSKCFVVDLIKLIPTVSNQHPAPLHYGTLKPQGYTTDIPIYHQSPGPQANFTHNMGPHATLTPTMSRRVMVQQPQHDQPVFNNNKVRKNNNANWWVGIREYSFSDISCIWVIILCIAEFRWFLLSATQRRKKYRFRELLSGLNAVTDCARFWALSCPKSLCLLLLNLCWFTGRACVCTDT